MLLTLCKVTFTLCKILVVYLEVKNENIVTGILCTVKTHKKHFKYYFQENKIKNIERDCERAHTVRKTIKNFDFLLKFAIFNF